MAQQCKTGGCTRRVNSDYPAARDAGMCFDCHFWSELVEMENSRVRAVRVDGQHYTIHPDKNAGFIGYGGQGFTILFDDGEVVRTNNMWSQGEIPELWRTRLPDNASFIPNPEAIQ